MQKSKNIHVIVASGEWNQDNLRYRRHRLAEYLLQHPDTEEVIWVCPNPNKRKDPFEKLDNGILQYHIADLHPNRLFRFGRYFHTFYKKRMRVLKNYLHKKSGHRFQLWYTFPGFPSLINIIPWENTAYDCSDLWTSSISGKKNIILTLRKMSIARSEKRIVKAVDKISCTSDYIKEYVMKTYPCENKDLRVFENGVEFQLFNSSSKKDVLPKLGSGPILGYVGGIKPKLDFPLLFEVMEKKKNWNLLLVGPNGLNNEATFNKLISLKNVTYLGKVSPFEVPAYMQRIDLGILPYKLSKYNNAVFPLKLYEFLAAGKAVIGYHLPSTKKYKSDGVYEYIEKVTAAEFISTCESYIEKKDDPLFVTKRKEVAKQKDWENIFDNMYSFVISNT